MVVQGKKQWTTGATDTKAKFQAKTNFPPKANSLPNKIK